MQKNTEEKNFYSENVMEFCITPTDLAELQNELKVLEEESKEIQVPFDFTVPDYIISEIIENENCFNHDNLYCLINCAVVNGRITPENARKIKEVY